MEGEGRRNPSYLKSCFVRFMSNKAIQDTHAVNYLKPFYNLPCGLKIVLKWKVPPASVKEHKLVRMYM
jgi:hypothetical protein